MSECQQGGTRFLGFYFLEVLDYKVTFLERSHKLKNVCKFKYSTHAYEKSSMQVGKHIKGQPRIWSISFSCFYLTLPQEEMEF